MAGSIVEERKKRDITEATGTVAIFRGNLHVFMQLPLCPDVTFPTYLP